MEATGIFTANLWTQIEDIYNDIINSTFVIGLSNGKLPEDAFNHYLSQDILYIKQDSIALSLLSQKAIMPIEKSFFQKMSNDCIEIETILHDELLEIFNTKEAINQSPAFAKYSNHIQNHASSSIYPVAIAALLPCFWVYGKMGHHILKTQEPNNKYQKFIDTYAGDEYIAYTREFINILENNADESVKSEIIHAFVTSSQHELSVLKEACSLSLV
jgi:thiaminase/transcriptional activator TenA